MPTTTAPVLSTDPTGNPTTSKPKGSVNAEGTVSGADQPVSTTIISIPATDPTGSPDTTRPAKVMETSEVSEAGSESRSPAVPASPVIAVMGAHPHDPEAFTQGLVLHDGRFYESTGLYGASTVRVVEPATGEVISSMTLGDGYFGEGLEVVDDRVVQLTWKEETAFIWDAERLEPLGSYPYEGEGWGLCAFEDRFVMSNGSSRLTYRDLETFEVIGGVDVHLLGEPVEHLNELECVGDLVYANVWLTDGIVVIAPDSGRVVAHIDASSLRGELPSSEGINVLNGIAYDPDRGVFYLTGKLWPAIFEVRIRSSP